MRRPLVPGWQLWVAAQRTPGLAVPRDEQEPTGPLASGLLGQGVLAGKRSEVVQGPLGVPGVKAPVTLAFALGLPPHLLSPSLFQKKPAPLNMEISLPYVFLCSPFCLYILKRCFFFSKYIGDMLHLHVFFFHAFLSLSLNLL